MAQGRRAEAQATAPARAGRSAPAGEPLFAFAAIAAQLALIIAVALRYRFESPAFRQCLPWLGVGFVVHHWLPARLRLAFFGGLSLAALGLALGARPGGFDLPGALLRGGVLLATGLALIAICQLRWPLPGRLAALLGVGAVLLALRAGSIGGDSLATVWPLLGAFFMFRLIVYFYDVQHEREPPGLARRLSYFFMLPNAFFPLFPVVDWKKFRADAADADPARARQICQTGLHSMSRGLLHVVLYRVVYYHFYIDASQVADGESLLRFLLANFALYLRVSGQFHMIVGLLQIFGFDLPRTNHHYFLADSFTDYWRRVNIYWKDFMVKIFYTPVAFRFRGRGNVLPVMAGTAAAFVATWLLHGYQSFWLRGEVSFSAQDGLFWSILGVLVMLNAAWEVRRGRRRSLSRRFDARATAWAAARTMGVFAALCALWSLWAAGSVAEWTALWRHADAAFVRGSLLTLLLVGACKIAVEAIEGFRGGVLTGALPKGASLRRTLATSLLTVVAPTAALGLLGDPRLHRRVDARTGFVLRSLTSNQPNTADLRAMERGYYENLFDATRGNFVDSGAQAPPDWIDFPEIPILRETGDLRFWELAPSRSEELNGFRFSTDALGLRDREYAREKPPGTYRIAILGSSHVMGWGVNDGETFEALVERRLAGQRADGKALEILNFGVGGYSPICQLGVIRERVLPLAPDAIYFVAHAVDGALAMERLSRLVARDIPLQDGFLRDVVARAGISRSMSQLAMQRELPPFAERLTRESYLEMVRLARESGAVAVWIYLPRITELVPDREQVGALQAMAAEAGFISLDLSGVWGDRVVDELAITPWDMHPNARGHEILAERLVEILRSDRRLGFSPGLP